MIARHRRLPYRPIIRRADEQRQLLALERLLTLLDVQPIYLPELLVPADLSDAEADAFLAALDPVDNGHE